MISEGRLLTYTQEGFRPMITSYKPPEEVRYEYVMGVLASHGGNISRTAAALNMPRRTIQRMRVTRYPFLRSAA